MLKKKQANGEELTEEEKEILNEKRERVKKKDQEENQAAAKGGKGGKAPPAKGKAAPAKGGAPAQEETEHETSKVEFPKAVDHYNDEINQFLNHFSSSRKIVNPKVSSPRKRSDEEKQKMIEDFES